MIACAHIPSFPVAVERHENTLLVSAPLILTDSKGKVFACCEASHRAGVGVGMRLSKARGCAPDAHIMPAVMSRYRAVQSQILDALQFFSHKVEIDRDMFFIDPGKLTQTQAQEIGQQIIDAVLESSGLCAAIGMASDRFSAEIAAKQTQSGQITIIHPSTTSAFLDRQPVSSLPLDGETARRFGLLGLHTLHDVQILPRSAMLAQFGKQGLFLHDLASGKDPRPVIATPRRRDIRQGFVFDCPVDNRFILENRLGKLIEDIIPEIHGEACTRLVLNIGTEDRLTFEQSLTPREPISMPKNIRVALYGLLDKVLTQSTLSSGVIALHIILEDLKPALPQQLSLFDEPDNQAVLVDCLPHLIKRHGPRFFTASEQDGDSPLLERRYRIDQVDTA